MVFFGISCWYTRVGAGYNAVIPTSVVVIYKYHADAPSKR